jgi:hypothetical protein
LAFLVAAEITLELNIYTFDTRLKVSAYDGLITLPARMQPGALDLLAKHWFYLNASLRICGAVGVVGRRKIGDILVVGRDAAPAVHDGRLAGVFFGGAKAGGLRFSGWNIFTVILPAQHSGKTLPWLWNILVQLPNCSLLQFHMRLCARRTVFARGSYWT